MPSTHKIVGGDGTWLGFARSRISALRAAGLNYASQDFLMPDGALVRVRVIGEQEFIIIDGSGGNIGMDSGAVDLISINENLLDRYTPGVLYETAAVTSYVAGYSLVGNATLRTNPSKDNNVQMAGIVVRRSRFIGAVPVDVMNAKSFYPRTMPDPIDNTQKIVNPDDNEALFSKKLSAALCPASIFTGKCRLYVQAMYGSFFAVGSKVSDFPVKVSGGDRAPYLRVQSHRPSGFKGVLPLVDVHTSCGVHLDPQTGKHWLIAAPAGDGIVRVYPLISSSVGEAWRKFLRDDSQEGLTELAREHLEAYILANSRPDALNVQTLTTLFSDSDYSCGYGWHFSWTGTVADVVVNKVWDQGDSIHTGTTSTRYRLNLAFTTVGKITAASAVVMVMEGPVNWSTIRDLWGIMHPSYTLTKLYKLPEEITLVGPCEAPFYAFYQRDELKVCRIKISQYDAGTSSSATPFATKSHLLSAGDRDGWAEDTETSAYMEATISVGDDKFGPCPNSKSSTETMKFVGEKVVNGYSDGFTAGYFEYTPVYLNSGYPEGLNDVWAKTFVPQVAYRYRYAQAPKVDFSIEDRTTSEASTSERGLVAIIPFDDAEAICVRVGVTFSKNVVKTGIRYAYTTTLNTTAGGTFWNQEVWSSVPVNPDGSYDYAHAVPINIRQAHYVIAQTSPVIWTPTAYSSNITTYKVTIDKTMLFAGGKINVADIGNIASMVEFFQPGDAVEKYMRCSAGINAETPAIYTTGFNVQTGMPSGLTLSNNGQGPVALVGWA